jgi:hypothetical protein
MIQAMQPIYGRLSDIFGRKFILLGSLVIFLIGSLACAVATVSEDLCVCGSKPNKGTEHDTIDCLPSDTGYRRRWYPDVINDY